MKADMSKEIKVGALIALGLLVIFIAVFIVGNQQGLFTSRYEVKAKFNNVEGLTVGAAVRLGGVKVGTVEGIHFSPDLLDKTVIVRMAISSAGFSRIKTDSKAKLGSQGLLGDRTIEISLGTPASRQIIQGECLTTVETAQLN
jgi:phospholipid/cholesterol/gamma-HCH transport system substrate-binding protein